jgi:serine/threonine-protein kinase
MDYGVSELPADERIGKRFGPYRIDSLAGEGGMAKVYEATDESGQRVALKIVKDEFAHNELFRRRFEREARIASTVHNPHVVPVINIGEHEGVPYLAQPFIDGCSLDERLRNEGRLELADVVKLCAEVAEGLQALSDAGMVHRDVKPANILLDMDDTAYVTDFGLARDTNDAPLTEPGSSLGSLAYMAPEQIRGEAVTSSADIYSLGCVMFECIQGRSPFADREGMRLLWAHLSEEPPDPDRETPEFIRVLKAALGKTPEERPSSCVEYARSLSESAAVTPAGAAG